MGVACPGTEHAPARQTAAWRRRPNRPGTAAGGSYERVWPGKESQIAMEAKLLLTEEALQTSNELAAKDAAEYLLPEGRNGVWDKSSANGLGKDHRLE